MNKEKWILVWKRFRKIFMNIAFFLSFFALIWSVIRLIGHDIPAIIRGYEEIPIEYIEDTNFMGISHTEVSKTVKKEITFEEAFNSIISNTAILILSVGLIIASPSYRKEVEEEEFDNTVKNQPLTREERWLLQEKKDRALLAMDDPRIYKIRDGIKATNDLWDLHRYMYDNANENSEDRSKSYLLLLTPKIFLENYYLFKLGNHDYIKDGIYTEFPYLVLETLIKMGLYIFSTNNNIRMLEEIIHGDKAEYLDSKALARQILNNECHRDA